MTHWLYDLCVIGLPFLAALLLSLLVLPNFIQLLKKWAVQQYLREEGPKSHAHKAKTPTAGGVCFIASTVVVLLAAWIWFLGFPGWEAIAVIVTAFICGGIGFLDDFAKIRLKSNAGLSARLRLGSEAILGALLGVGLITLIGHHAGAIYISPFHRLIPLPLPLFIFLSAFLMAATTNALNLHDGMDGLAAGTSSLALLTLTTIFFCLGILPLAIISATACGAILGFLAFNKNPAKIFMGDTGSLFIGGLIAALVIASGTVLYFIPLSLVFIAEAVSVMLQVSYFKLTKSYTPERPMSTPALAVYKLTHRLPGEGKRLFRMAPLHHHFEAVLAEKGVKEWQVVAGFWAVQAVLCLFVLLLFFTFPHLLR